MGGMNHNGGIDQAEVFLNDKGVWKMLKSKMTKSRRAAFITEVNSIPTLVGGSECNAQGCSKSASSITYATNATAGTTFTDDYFTDKSDWILSQAKSSMGVVGVAEDYFGTCN